MLPKTDPIHGTKPVAMVRQVAHQCAARLAAEPAAAPAAAAAGPAAGRDDSEVGALRREVAAQARRIESLETKVLRMEALVLAKLG